MTPRGVKSDARIVDDADPDPTWDAVWDAAVARDSAGWSVELRIPLSQLPHAAFRADHATEWGVNFERYLNRRGERSQWALVPQTASRAVTWYGVLRLPPIRAAAGRLQLTPYALVGATRSDARLGAAAPRTGSTATAGGDVQFALSPAFGVTAAVNPDFRQVEADPTTVNLSALELFLPERRPFFVAGADLIRFALNQPAGDASELFYSRRVGRRPTLGAPDGTRVLDAPRTGVILGAAKLTGRTPSGWNVGAFDALAADRWVTYLDGVGARRVTQAEPATNTAVARLTRDLRAGQTSVGVIGTAVTRRLDARADSALHRAAYTAGVDGHHRVRGYLVEAQVVGTHVSGSPSAIRATQAGGVHLFQRPDLRHVHLDGDRTALTGWAASARAAKVDGNTHWEIARRTYSPTYEPNDAGFLAQADRVQTFAHVDYTRPVTDRTSLRRWSLAGYAWNNRDFGGTRTARGVEFDPAVQFQNFVSVNAWFGRRSSVIATDLLRGGPGLRVAPQLYTGTSVASDARRPVALTVFADLTRGGVGAPALATVTAGLTARPSGRVEVAVSPSLATRDDPQQYVAAVTTLQDPHWIVGRVRQRTASVTFRGSFVFSPALSVDAYAQPFVSRGLFAELGEVAAPRAARFAERVAEFGPSALTLDASGRRWIVAGDDAAHAYDFARPDFATRSLNASVVLRWEYGRGSVASLVWSHDRSAGDAADVAAGRGWRDGVQQLWRTPGTNQLAVKISRWFAP